MILLLAAMVFLPMLLGALCAYVALKLAIKLVILGTLALGIVATGLVALLAGLLAQPQDS